MILSIYLDGSVMQVEVAEEKIPELTDQLKSRTNLDKIKLDTGTGAVAYACPAQVHGFIFNA